MKPKVAEIVPFCEAWLEAVAALEKRAGDVQWSKAQFAKELTLPISRFFVLLQDGQLIGYGGYWKVDLEAQITNLVIDPDHRRQGFGKQLLGFLIENAKLAGCQACTLEVKASNRAASLLYAKMGFEAVGRRPRLYDEKTEAILMEKTL